MTVRESQVEAAVRFLKNPSVTGRSDKEKQDFLVQKGLTQDEIAEAIKRASGESASASSSSSTAAASSLSAPSASSTTTSPAPAAAPASSPAPQASSGSLPGGYPAAASSSAPATYAAPPAVAPVPMVATAYPPSPWSAPGGYAVPPSIFPTPPAQASRTPWYAWLLGGLSLGSLLALVFNLLFPKRRQAALELHRSQHVPPRPLPQAVPVLGPNGTVQYVPTVDLPGGLPALADADSAEPSSGSDDKTSKMVRLEELAGYVRRHVEETREASGALRRTLEMQQRQYQATLSDFQRKFDEAGKRKPNTALPRMEIAPESMKMLKSLIRPAVVAGGGDGAEAAEPKQWFSQVEASLCRLLQAASCKAEAKKSLQTVSLILSNLVSTSAQQEKFREVNTSSSRFREQVGIAGEELLQLAGFERSDSGFAFPVDAPSTLEKAGRVHDFLQASLRDCDQRWEAAQVGESAAPCSAEVAVGTEVCEAAAAPPKPPWASSSVPCANGTAPGPTNGTSSSSTAPTEVARPAAPWLSSALTRGLNRMPNPASADEAPQAPNGHTAVAHPAESADVEETQRAPG